MPMRRSEASGALPGRGPERRGGGERRQRVFLVTGGCGFIGARLVAALLRRGHAVRVLDNLSTGRLENLAAGAALLRRDVRDRAALAEAMAGVDGCFHLAAVSSVELSNRNWVESHDVNLAGTIAVLDASRRVAGSAPVRIVFASSASVYGDGAAPPFHEAMPPSPVSAYGADKLACEVYARIAQLLHDVPSVGVRLFNVFGPQGESTPLAAGVASIFCDRIAAGRPVTIFGDGRQTRDFVHIDDAVAGLLAAMDARGIGHALVNICTGRATSVMELAEAIAELCGTTLRVTHAAMQEGHVRASVGDPTLARELLGFAARVELRPGLAAMLRSRARHDPHAACIVAEGKPLRA